MEELTIATENESPFMTLQADTASNAITFHLNGEPMLELQPNGDFYVKGNLVTTDMEVYEGFKEWLKKSMEQI